MRPTAPQTTSAARKGETETQDNTATDTPPTITGTEAESVITGALADVASGQIEPGAGGERSGSEAAAAADVIGRRLARDGATADISEPLQAIASVRESLVPSSTPDDLRRFDDAVRTLVVERVLAATGAANADTSALSAARDTLQTESFIPTSTEVATIFTIQPLIDISIGLVPPDPALNFSDATPEQLGSAAVDAADRFGRLAGAVRQNDQYDAALGTIASVRAQLVENGANALQLNSFDTTVFDIAEQRAFQIVGDTAFDPGVLQRARNTLKNGELDALRNPGGDVFPDILEEVEALVADAASITYDPAVADASAAGDTDGIVRDLRNIQSAFAGEAQGFVNAPSFSPLTIDEAKVGYAAIRQQLSADGASARDLAELDAAVVQLSARDALRQIDFDLGDDTRLTIDPNRNAISILNATNAIVGTELTRTGRLDPEFELNQEDVIRVREVISQAVTNDTDAEFEGGNLRVASPTDLGQQLSRAADTVAQGLEAEDDAVLQTGFDLFDQLRDEIIRRSPGNELPPGILQALENRIAFVLAQSKNPSAANVDRVIGAGTALIEAVGDFRVQEPFGVASQTSFVGDNGADPAQIFVIELKPGESPDPRAAFGGHDVAVTDVIESQLREAGQSYDLTNLQASAGLSADNDPITRGTAVVGAIRSVIETVEASGEPAYLNLSLGRGVDAALISRAFEALEGTDLVEGIDPDAPITQENFDDFAGVVRAIGLAATDPARADVLEALGTDGRRWQVNGAITQAMEDAAAANIDVFVAVPNDNTDFSSYQFVSDEGAPGSITRVGSMSRNFAAESDLFVLPNQGETFPATAFFLDGILFSDNRSSFYRGEGVDVYANGLTRSGLGNNRSLGSSFASPEMLVNAVLGLFDPDTETRTGGASV